MCVLLQREVGWCKTLAKNTEPTLELAAMSRTGMPVIAVMSAAFAEFGW